MTSDSNLAEESRREVASFDGNVAQEAFLIGFFQNIFFYCLLTYQSVLTTATALLQRCKVVSSNQDIFHKS